MRHLAVYLMLVIGGNASPTAEDVTNALAAAGVEVDAERLATLISELEGKDLEELIALGTEKLMVGGGGGGGGGGDSGGATVEAPAAVVEKPKEEEVDALAGGMDMFGGEGGSDY
eukprot:CAMPEP_0114426294 /NCGR_PEP_ID=MMETSP0103-20121206/7718_1 /TAXON_ID=37642 ORGANISM="Paraphysomonas imperforata, Strain PA2" /NCGR_SAMPLE_ID=MMETSP0103 /ASSEMBLY_ACC=CAM_ASM_000201 /LENGTH=114 /DNA_ID=CAMNT_0001595239 /DNA_START=44 /DNA_END=388 /DNA_ORIENTATION=-